MIRSSNVITSTKQLTDGYGQLHAETSDRSLRYPIEQNGNPREPRPVYDDLLTRHNTSELDVCFKAFHLSVFVQSNKKMSWKIYVVLTVIILGETLPTKAVKRLEYSGSYESYHHLKEKISRINRGLITLGYRITYGKKRILDSNNLQLSFYMLNLSLKEKGTGYPHLSDKDCRNIAKELLKKTRHSKIIDEHDVIPNVCFNQHGVMEMGGEIAELLTDDPTWIQATRPVKYSRKLTRKKPKGIIILTDGEEIEDDSLKGVAIHLPGIFTGESIKKWQRVAPVILDSDEDAEYHPKATTKDPIIEAIIQRTRFVRPKIEEEKVSIERPVVREKKKERSPIQEIVLESLRRRYGITKTEVKPAEEDEVGPSLRLMPEASSSWKGIITENADGDESQATEDAPYFRLMENYQTTEQKHSKSPRNTNDLGQNVKTKNSTELPRPSTNPIEMKEKTSARFYSPEQSASEKSSTTELANEVFPGEPDTSGMSKNDSKNEPENRMFLEEEAPTTQIEFQFERGKKYLKHFQTSFNQTGKVEVKISTERAGNNNQRQFSTETSYVNGKTSEKNASEFEVKPNIFTPKPAVEILFETTERMIPRKVVDQLETDPVAEFEIMPEVFTPDAPEIIISPSTVTAAKTIEIGQPTTELVPEFEIMVEAFTPNFEPVTDFQGSLHGMITPEITTEFKPGSIRQSSEQTNTSNSAEHGKDIRRKEDIHKTTEKPKSATSSFWERRNSKRGKPLDAKVGGEHPDSETDHGKIPTLSSLSRDSSSSSTSKYDNEEHFVKLQDQIESVPTVTGKEVLNISRRGVTSKKYLNNGRGRTTPASITAGIKNSTKPKQYETSEAGMISNGSLRRKTPTKNKAKTNETTKRTTEYYVRHTESTTKGSIRSSATKISKHSVSTTSSPIGLSSQKGSRRGSRPQSTSAKSPEIEVSTAPSWRIIPDADSDRPEEIEDNVYTSAALPEIEKISSHLGAYIHEKPENATEVSPDIVFTRSSLNDTQMSEDQLPRQITEYTTHSLESENTEISLVLPKKIEQSAISFEEEQQTDNFKSKLRVRPNKTTITHAPIQGTDTPDWTTETVNFRIMKDLVTIVKSGPKKPTTTGYEKTKAVTERTTKGESFSKNEGTVEIQPTALETNSTLSSWKTKEITTTNATTENPLQDKEKAEQDVEHGTENVLKAPILKKVQVESMIIPDLKSKVEDESFDAKKSSPELLDGLNDGMQGPLEITTNLNEGSIRLSTPANEELWRTNAEQGAEELTAVSQEDPSPRNRELMTTEEAPELRFKGDDISRPMPVEETFTTEPAPVNRMTFDQISNPSTEIPIEDGAPGLSMGVSEKLISTSIEHAALNRADLDLNTSPSLMESSRDEIPVLRIKPEQVGTMEEVTVQSLSQLEIIMAPMASSEDVTKNVSRLEMRMQAEMVPDILSTNVIEICTEEILAMKIQDDSSPNAPFAHSEGVTTQGVPIFSIINDSVTENAIEMNTDFPDLRLKTDELQRNLTQVEDMTTEDAPQLRMKTDFSYDTKEREIEEGKTEKIPIWKIQDDDLVKYLEGVTTQLIPEFRIDTEIPLTSMPNEEELNTEAAGELRMQTDISSSDSFKDIEETKTEDIPVLMMQDDLQEIVSNNTETTTLDVPVWRMRTDSPLNSEVETNTNTEEVPVMRIQTESMPHFTPMDNFDQKIDEALLSSINDEIPIKLAPEYVNRRILNTQNETSGKTEEEPPHRLQTDIIAESNTAEIRALRMEDEIETMTTGNTPEFRVETDTPLISVSGNQTGVQAQDTPELRIQNINDTEEAKMNIEHATKLNRDPSSESGIKDIENFATQEMPFVRIGTETPVRIEAEGKTEEEPGLRILSEVTQKYIEDSLTDQVPAFMKQNDDSSEFKIRGQDEATPQFLPRHTSESDELVTLITKIAIDTNTEGIPDMRIQSDNQFDIKSRDITETKTEDVPGVRMLSDYLSNVDVETSNEEKPVFRIETENSLVLESRNDQVANTGVTPQLRIRAKDLSDATPKNFYDVNTEYLLQMRMQTDADIQEVQTDEMPELRMQDDRFAWSELEDVENTTEAMPELRIDTENPVDDFTLRAELNEKEFLKLRTQTDVSPEGARATEETNAERVPVPRMQGEEELKYEQKETDVTAQDVPLFRIDTESPLDIIESGVRTEESPALRMQGDAFFKITITEEMPFVRIETEALPHSVSDKDFNNEEVNALRIQDENKELIEITTLEMPVTKIKHENLSNENYGELKELVQSRMQTDALPNTTIKDDQDKDAEPEVSLQTDPFLGATTSNIEENPNKTNQFLKNTSNHSQSDGQEEAPFFSNAIAENIKPAAAEGMQESKIESEIAIRKLLSSTEDPIIRKLISSVSPTAESILSSTTREPNAESPFNTIQTKPAEDMPAIGMNGRSGWNTTFQDSEGVTVTDLPSLRILENSTTVMGEKSLHNAPVTFEAIQQINVEDSENVPLEGTAIPQTPILDLQAEIDFTRSSAEQVRLSTEDGFELRMRQDSPLITERILNFEDVTFYQESANETFNETNLQDPDNLREPAPQKVQTESPFVVKTASTEDYTKGNPSYYTDTYSSVHIIKNSDTPKLRIGTDLEAETNHEQLIDNQEVTTIEISTDPETNIEGSDKDSLLNDNESEFELPTTAGTKKSNAPTNGSVMKQKISHTTEPNNKEGPGASARNKNKVSGTATSTIRTTTAKRRTTPTVNERGGQTKKGRRRKTTTETISEQRITLPVTTEESTKTPGITKQYTPAVRLMSDMNKTGRGIAEKQTQPPLLSKHVQDSMNVKNDPTSSNGLEPENGDPVQVLNEWQKTDRTSQGKEVNGEENAERPQNRRRYLEDVDENVDESTFSDGRKARGGFMDVITDEKNAGEILHIHDLGITDTPHEEHTKKRHVIKKVTTPHYSTTTVRYSEPDTEDSDEINPVRTKTTSPDDTEDEDDEAAKLKIKINFSNTNPEVQRIADTSTETGNGSNVKLSIKIGDRKLSNAAKAQKFIEKKPTKG